MNNKFYIVGVLAKQGDDFIPVNDYVVVRNVRHFRNQFLSQLREGKIPEMINFPNDYKLVAFTFCPATFEMFKIEDTLVADLLKEFKVDA